MRRAFTLISGMCMSFALASNDVPAAVFCRHFIEVADLCC